MPDVRSSVVLSLEDELAQDLVKHREETNMLHSSEVTREARIGGKNLMVPNVMDDGLGLNVGQNLMNSKNDLNLGDLLNL